MRTPVRLRGNGLVRLAWLVAGLLVFAAGIVALLESGLGLSPWDVLHQGLERRTPLSFGAASILVALVVLAAARLLGARLGIGTVANAVLVGAFVDLLAAADWVVALGDGTLATRVALLAAGLVLMAVGTGLYLGADLGAGPRDSLMVVGAARTGLRIGPVRAAIEIAALAVGFLLGGSVGLGTVAFALAIGPLLELVLALLARSPLARPSCPRRPQPACRQALESA